MTTWEKLTVAAVAVAVLLELGVGAARVRAAQGRPAARRPGEVDAAAFLRAVAERESGNNPAAVGRFYGERSKYQFLPETWAQHTRRPFAEATTDPRCADFVAAAHYLWLKRQLERRGIVVSVRALAAAWHYGQGFAVACMHPPYAHEEENLYESEVGR